MIYIWIKDLSIIAVKFTIENIENCLQQVYELEKDNRPKDVTEQTYFDFKSNVYHSDYLLLILFLVKIFYPEKCHQQFLN